MIDKSRLERHGLSYSSQNKVMDWLTVFYGSGALVSFFLILGVFIYNWLAHPVSKKKERSDDLGLLIEEASKSSAPLVKKSEDQPAKFENSVPQKEKENDEEASLKKSSRKQSSSSQNLLQKGSTMEASSQKDASAEEKSTGAQNSKRSSSRQVGQESSQKNIQ